MGKVPYYTDSESEASTSAETMKKKKKFSILKYTTDSTKKKCRVHSLPRPEEPESQFTTKMQKLRGILKHNTNKEYSASEDDLEEFHPSYSYPAGKCLVGRVPRQPGGRPGHGGGVAIVVRRSPRLQSQSLRAQPSVSGAKVRKSMLKRLGRKPSY